MADVRAIAEAYIQAYNDFNIDGLGELMDDNIELVHHNRGFQTSGREATLELYRGTPEVLPDRQLTNRKGITIDGNLAIVRHALTGTPKVDLPFGSAGESIDFAITTVLTISDEGKVVRYEDYG